MVEGQAEEDELLAERQAHRMLGRGEQTTKRKLSLAQINTEINRN